MSKTPLCYIARHGTTALNAQGAFRGHRDVPLDGEGIKEAENLAKFFEPIDAAAIFSSDKKRAIQTAEIINKCKQIPFIITASLRPWDVGEFSGQPKDEENMKKLEYYIFNADVDIPGGESLANFKSRVRPSLINACDHAVNFGSPVIVVGHSSIVHEASDLAEGHHESSLVHPGGVSVLQVENGKLHARAILKPKPSKSRVDQIS